MKSVKKLFSAILVMFGAAFLVCAFGVALMMIFHISLFGYTFVSGDGSKITQEYSEAQTEALKSVEIESSGVGVKIVNSTDDGFQKCIVSMSQGAQGVAKDTVKKNTFKDVEHPVIDENGVMKIETVEPTGFIWKNDSIITITLPKTKTLENLRIKTASTNIIFGDSESNCSINNLSFTSTNHSLVSNMALTNIESLENLDLNVQSGRMVIDANIANAVNIETERAVIIFNKDIGGTVNISGNNPDIQFGYIPDSYISDIESGKSSTGLTEVNIGGDLNLIELEKGSVRIAGTVSGCAYLNKSFVTFVANNINKGISCDEGLNDIKIIGALRVENADGTCQIKTTGALFINASHAKLVVDTSNNLTIKNAYESVDVISSGGNTNIAFNKMATSKTISVLQKNGNIEVSNIMDTASLTAENGKIIADFKNVSGNNNLRAKSGVEVTIKDGEQFTLILQGKATTKLDVKLGAVVYDNWETSTAVGDLKYIQDNVNAGSDELLEDRLSILLENGGNITAKFAN